MRTILLLIFLMFGFLVACSGDGDSEMDMTDHSEMDMSDDMMDMDLPADLDLAMEKATDNGNYQVTLVPNVDPVPLNELHTWTLTVADQAGAAVSDATVTIGGGMPQHDHGFPTEPAVTATDEAGVYLVEGIRYQMGGWWEMTFEIAAADTTDTVTFNVVLQ